MNGAPQSTLPSGVTQQDALVGSFLDVFLHETGHAVFDVLKVPVFGREEDAADLFSAYIMLQFGKEDAHGLILGSAYQYKADVSSPQVPVALRNSLTNTGFQRSAFLTCCVLRMAPTKSCSPILLRWGTSQRVEQTVVTANTSKPLSRSIH